MPKLEWKRIEDQWDDPAKPQGFTYRAKVPGGWLVSVWAGTEDNHGMGGGLTFVPDPGHSAWQVDNKVSQTDQV